MKNNNSIPFSKIARKVFLLLLFANFQYITYGQYVPFKIEDKGIAGSVLNYVDADNRRKAEYGEMAIRAINSATEALENKKYVYAISEFKRSLELLEKSNLKYAKDYYETVRSINEAIEYCEYKKDNPYDNPFYKVKLGYFTPMVSTRNVYGYGSSSQLQFVVFEISVSEHILLLAENTKEFSEHLLSLYNMLKAPNGIRDVSKKLKQGKIVIPYTVHYIDAKTNNGFSSIDVFLKIINYYDDKNYGVTIDDNKGNQLLFFPLEKLDSLKKFCDIVSTSSSCYSNKEKEKATDSDNYVRLLNRNN